MQIFRQDSSGEIVAATFDISGEGFEEAGRVWIRNGDIIAVADTARSQTRRILSSMFRVFVGATYNIAEATE